MEAEKKTQKNKNTRKNLNPQNENVLSLYNTFLVSLFSNK